SVASTSGVPTGGNVTFKDGNTILGTSDLVNGKAAFNATALAAGTHTITATYAGSGGFAGSNSAAQTVAVQVATITTLDTSAKILMPDQAVTLTVYVGSDAGVPTGGKVTFKDGSTTLGTVNVVNGKATFNVAALTAGSHTITATFAG